MNKKTLMEIVKKSKNQYVNGKVATYIPALSKVRPDELGLTVYDLHSNNIINIGDYQTRFAIESISKVPVLLLAIEQNGISKVFKKVDAEPTGFSFNSILNMEIENRKYPMNPFVNTGAIVINSLITGSNSDERFNQILNFVKKICNDNEITLNTEIYKSESKTGDINRSLAYYMKNNRMFEGDVEDVLDSYFKQCSLNVNTMDLANLAGVLANKGIAPWDNERIVSEESAKIVKSIMTTAGLYDESGDFSVHVGVPAKSGVGGGLMAAVPEKCGIGIYGPALDKFGNSVAGMKVLNKIVDKYDLNIFD